MLSAVNMTYKRILKDINLEFKQGKWTHIIGPNGAGKSTLLKLLCGLILPTSGNICIQNQSLFTLSHIERAKYIAYVPQRLENLPEITVFDFVMQSHFALSDDKSAILYTKNALERVQLMQLATRRLNTLSGGELQRAMIAAALAQNTPVILLDEPTTSLDMAQSEKIHRLLYTICASGKTIISVTHDLKNASWTADHTVVLKDGNILWNNDGFPEDTFLNTIFETTCIHLHDAPKPSDIDSDSQTQDAPVNKEFSLLSSISTKRFLYISFFILLLLLWIMPWIGSTCLNPTSLSAMDRHILIQLRIPRVLWGMMSGATLACVGAALQSMLQNPLATPYTLGMASGASLGAMLAISLGVTSLWLLPTASFAGGMSIMAIVLTFAARASTRSPAFFIIAGVAASMFCSAISMIFQATAAPLTAQQMMRWQMGGLDVVGYTTIALFPIILLSLIGIYCLSKPLSLLAVDASLAQTRGVNVSRVRIMTFILSSLATSLVISICGPISFVGLLVPLALRRRFGAELPRLMPLCAVMGAVFILLADMIARIVEAYAAIPVGVVVSMIGVPAVILFLLPKRASCR